MIDFIDIENYHSIYINLCLILTGLMYLHCMVININDGKNLLFLYVAGFLLMTFLILYIGLRPVTGGFGDTVNYRQTFYSYKYGAPIGDVKDLGWHLFMKGIAQYFSVHFFFTVCSFIYIFPFYKLSKFYFKDYWFYAFLMFVVSFSFWSYGTNGVRNGVAGSVFLWGLCYKHKKLLMALFFLIAISFHKTLLLPVLAFLITYIHNNPKTYFKAWFISIPLSIAASGVWIALFSSLGFGDERAAAYLSNDALQGTATKAGFRWDFLFYSSFAVVAGWYFVIKKGFKDRFYFRLFNTYLICNAFWILVIQANYSNRFAYLSWFMMAIVIVYPILKGKFFRNQQVVMSNIITAYFAFTYLMYLLYY